MGLLVQGSVANATDAAAQVAQAPKNVSASSMEQLFSPVLIRRGRPRNASDKLSAFENPNDTIQSCGPFAGDHVGPTRAELDPYFTNVLDGDDATFMKENDYQMVNNEVRAGNQGLEEPDLNQRKTSRHFDSVTVTHFRGPMVLSGWGFDHADQPVPQFVDLDVPKGVPQYQFDTAFANDRGSWKSGPIDLKWDKQRKVWGAGHHMLIGVADEDIVAPVNPCLPTYFKMKVLRRDLPEDQEFDTQALSNARLNEVVKLTNRDPSLEQELVLNKVFVMAVRINYEWLPVWVGCPAGDGCPGGTGDVKDKNGNVVSTQGECFCFLSKEEEKVVSSISSASEDCMDQEDGDNPPG